MLVEPMLGARRVARRARPAPRGRDFGALWTAWPGADVWRARPVREACLSDDGALALRLEHETLGPIEIRVAVRDRGVHAVLLARDGAARETLAGGRAVLEAALRRADLRLAGFGVGLRPHDRATCGRAGQGAAPSRPTADPAGAIATGGLDLRA